MNVTAEAKAELLESIDQLLDSTIFAPHTRTTQHMGKALAVTQGFTNSELSSDQEILDVCSVYLEVPDLCSLEATSRMTWMQLASGVCKPHAWFAAAGHVGLNFIDKHFAKFKVKTNLECLGAGPFSIRLILFLQAQFKRGMYWFDRFAITNYKWWYIRYIWCILHMLF